MTKENFEDKRTGLIVKVNELKGYVRFTCNIKYEQKEKILDMLNEIYKILKGK